MKNVTTYLWRITPQKRRVLMATIMPGSSYYNYKLHQGKKFTRKKDREQTARMIARGWQHNGQFPPGTTWEVE